MMRLAKGKPQLAYHVIGQIGCGWKTGCQRGAHRILIRGHITHHAAGGGNGNRQRVDSIENAFLVFLHIFAIGKRQAFEHDQQTVQRSDNAAGFGAYQFRGIRIAFLRHDR